MGREFDDKFLKNVQSPPQALPPPPPPRTPAGFTLIGALHHPISANIRTVGSQSDFENFVIVMIKDEQK